MKLMIKSVSNYWMADCCL